MGVSEKKRIKMIALLIILVGVHSLNVIDSRASSCYTDLSVLIWPLWTSKDLDVVLRYTYYDKFGRKKVFEFILKSRMIYKRMFFLLLIVMMLAGDIEKNPGPDVNCKKCMSLVVDSDKEALGCDACEGWYHKTCSGLIEAEYKIMKKATVMWICGSCKPMIRGKSSLMSIENKLEKMNESMINIDKKLGDYEGRFGNLEAQVIGNEIFKNHIAVEVTNLKDRLQLLEEKIEEGINISNNVDQNLEKIEEVKISLESKMRSEFTVLKKNLEEDEQIKLREKNIILFNIKDMKDSTLCEKNDRDILEKILGIIGLDFLKTTIRFKRISVFSETKPRPLLVSFDSIREKWRFFACHTILKMTEDDEIKKVSMVPDRSLMQREAAKALRKELLRRRDLKEDVIIYRNEIIERSNLQFKKIEFTKLLD